MRIFFSILIILTSSNSIALEYKKSLSDRRAELNSDANILKEAQELETVLVAKMIEPIFPDGLDSNLYGDKYATPIFKSMMVNEYAKALVNTNSLGLTEAIAEEIKQKRKVK